MSTIPLTKVGAEQLKAELHRLKTVDRIETSKAIGEARLQGDISENADYDAAKEKQSFIEGRIQDIEGKLGNAQVIDPKTMSTEAKVMFGATVEYEDCDTEKRSTYQIVGEDEADFKIGKISIGSPLARAFIGKSAGDVVEVQAPGGAREVEIVSVRYI